MNRTLSRTILGVLVLVASGIVTGGAAQPPAASQSGPTPVLVDELPYACLLEKNLGACVNCCMEATGLSGRICAHWCLTVRFPPPPPPEPQP